MSRTDIPTDKPLSDDDRAYLLMRGEDARVKWFDQVHPPVTEEDDLDDEELDDGYDDMTVAQLQEELKSRNLDTNGKKDALIARLREDDSDEE